MDKTLAADFAPAVEGGNADGAVVRSGPAPTAVRDMTASVARGRNRQVDIVPFRQATSVR